MHVKSSDDLWVLESAESAYAFGVEPGGLLVHTYWGPRLPRFEDYPKPTRAGFTVLEDPVQNTPQEVTTGEAGDSNERTLDGVAADGQLRGFVLRFDGIEQTATGLNVRLVDRAQAINVTLGFAVGSLGLFTRSLSIANDGVAPVLLTRVFTGAFQLPQLEEFALTYFDGRWADEFVKQRRPVEFGSFVRESRRLTTSHRGMPFFAIDRIGEGEAASEHRGDVWFGTLEWSGNWKMIAERTRTDRTVIHLGLNDHDFAWELHPGETFDAPRVVFGHTTGGFGAMSRAFHDLVRQERAPTRDYLPPVLYNSWMATAFDVNEPGQVALAKEAASIGAELFVVDDGWFAGRNGDDAGLGDWYADPVKFPNGLKGLVAAVHDLGMKFGLWLEPEMVSPLSELYRAHPDWIVHFPGRPRTLSRNQSILNLARSDVQDHLIETIDRLLGDSPIDFIKWDMNRNVSEPGWPGHQRDQRELWVRYVDGMYRVWNELRRRHPRVIWENCSGGGGRVDLGMMALTEQTWISDNTNPAARLEIQEGYSLLFPANTMASWVSDDPFPADSAASSSERGEIYPFEFRFHVSMAGALGIGGNLMQWTERERVEAAGYVAQYKQLRPLIAHGDLYRISSPHRGPLSALMYVAKDKSDAVLFAFKTHVSRLDKPVRLKLAGLDGDDLYAIEGCSSVLTGQAWAVRGLELSLKNFESRVLRVRRVSDAAGPGITSTTNS